MKVSVGGAPLGAGTLRVFAEDAQGDRHLLGESADVTGGPAGVVLAERNLPGTEVVAITAVFVGVDAVGEQVVAAGSLAF